MSESRIHWAWLFSNFWMLRIWVLASFFLIGLGLAGAEDMDIKGLAESKEWLRLLHFRPPLSKRSRSEVGPSEFFLSSQGHLDPYQELLADIDAFSNPVLRIGRDQMHPQCALPIRFEFLKKKLRRDFPAIDCSAYQEYLASLQLQSVTVVFASAFQSNAASMFGHIFLRFDSLGKSPLIEKTLSYAADISPDENPLEFAIKGVWGGYQGRFALVPYYKKIKEYDQLEARDLWEYRLRLSPEETRVLAGHAWELDQTARLQYYFFDLNCAYQLLALLEVARPDWDLTGYGIHVLPVDALKKIVQLDGAVTSVTWRPASEKKIDAALLSLDLRRRQSLDSFLKGQEELEDLEVLKLAADWLVNEGPEVDGSVRSKALSLLNERTSGGTTLQIPKGNLVTTGRPDWGHSSYRVGFSSGATDKESEMGYQRFFDLEFRSAYHDLLDPDLGYTAFSEITFPSVRLRSYDPFREISVERVDLVNVVTLVPQRPKAVELSWSLLSQFSTPKDRPCFDCKVLNLEGGGGMSWADDRKTCLFYFLAGAAASAGDLFPRGYRTGPKLETGWLAHPFRKYKLQIRGQSYFWSVTSGAFEQLSVFDFNQSWSFREDWNVRVNIQRLYGQHLPKGPTELGLSVFRYF